MKIVNVSIQADEEMTGRKVEKVIQFIKFGIVGVSNSVISYCVYAIVLAIFHNIDIKVSLDYMVAQAIAFFISVMWAFYWNYTRVFTENEKKEFWGVLLLKTYLCYAFTGLILSTVLAYVWIDIVGISKWISPIINIVINTPINFLLNKCWTFKEKI